jgi:prepilin-type N-terminal cleavage/methylation domain-containing protein
MRGRRVNVSGKGNAINCIALNLLKSRMTSGESGYSLVELIITIILIGIAFPGLLGFLTNSIFNTVENEVINKAVLLATDKMEQITADKNELTRGIPYITTPNQYPSESIDQFIRNVLVQTSLIDNIPIIKVTVTITHPVLTNSFNLTQIFTDYNGI